jgi:DNA-directed RNA polymerase specialized sigma24 family protein
MPSKHEGPVTRDLANLKEGVHESSATRRIWEKTFEKLVRKARTLLRNTPRRAADEEDVALSAFQSFCDGVKAGRFPDLENSANLWKLLYTITARKVHALAAREGSQKRDAGRVVEADIEAVIDDERAPEFVAMMVDELRVRLDLLRDENLRQVALLLLEGWSNEEIAAKLECSDRTIERKRKLIRRAWEKERPE